MTNVLEAEAEAIFDLHKWPQESGYNFLEGKRHLIFSHDLYLHNFIQILFSILSISQASKWGDTSSNTKVVKSWVK